MNLQFLLIVQSRIVQMRVNILIGRIYRMYHNIHKTFSGHYILLFILELLFSP